MIPRSYTEIARNAGFLFGLQSLQRILGLLTTYFVVRAISQSSYGEYNFALSLIDVIAIAALPGLGNAVMQSVARQYRGTYRAALRPSFLCSLVGSAVLLGMGGWYLRSGSTALAVAFLGAAALFPFAYGLTQWKGLKMGGEDFAGIARLEGITAVATSLALIVAVLSVSQSIATLVVIILLARSVLNVFVTRRTLGQVGKGEPVESGSIRYGVKTTAYSVFGLVAKHVDKLLLFTFMTPATVGVFVAAERIPELIKEQIKNLAAVAAPRFARHERYTKRVDRAFRLFSFVVGGVIVLVAFTILPWALLLIYGESYRESVPYAQALMCSLAIANTAPLRFRFVSSRQDTASFRDVNAFVAIFRIVVSAVLVPTLGLLGAVLSAFAARIGYVVAINIVMKKRYPLDEAESGPA